MRKFLAFVCCAYMGCSSSSLLETKTVAIGCSNGLCETGHPNSVALVLSKIPLKEILNAERLRDLLEREGDGTRKITPYGSGGVRAANSKVMFTAAHIYRAIVDLDDERYPVSAYPYFCFIANRPLLIDCMARKDLSRDALRDGFSDVDESFQWIGREDVAVFGWHSTMDNIGLQDLVTLNQSVTAPTNNEVFEVNGARYGNGSISRDNLEYSFATPVNLVEAAGTDRFLSATIRNEFAFSGTHTNANIRNFEIVEFVDEPNGKLDLREIAFGTAPECTFNISFPYTVTHIQSSGDSGGIVLRHSEAGEADSLAGIVSGENNYPIIFFDDGYLAYTTEAPESCHYRTVQHWQQRVAELLKDEEQGEKFRQSKQLADRFISANKPAVPQVNTQEAMDAFRRAWQLYEHKVRSAVVSGRFEARVDFVARKTARHSESIGEWVCERINVIDQLARDCKLAD